MIRMSSKSPSLAPTAASSGTQIPRVLLVIVIALIIVVVAFGIVPFLQNAFNAAPNVTIENKVPSSSGCGTGGGGSPSYYTYSWTFDLKNNGNTNANATIIVYIVTYTNPSALATHVYAVPKASIVPNLTISYDATTLGCTPVSLDIKVQSTIAT